MSVRIALLGEDTLSDATEVLVRAFAGYPFLERCFSGAAESQVAMRRRLFSYALRYRIATGIPALVALDGDDVVGAATLLVPDGPEMSDAFKAEWEIIESLCTLEGVELFRRYDEAEIAFPGPAVYVVAIGVDPSLHGQGVGRLLLDAALDLARRHPLAEGLALDTHAVENVEKYKRLGFEIVVETDLLGIPNWYFWKRLA